MEAMLAPLRELKEYNEIKELLKVKGKSISIYGGTPSQSTHLMKSIGDDFKYKVIITFSEQKAKELYESYRVYDKDCFLYPAKDFIFYSADMQGDYIVRNRLEAVKQIVEGKPGVIIATLPSFMNKVLPLDYFRNNILVFKTGEKIVLQEAVKDFVKLGYERTNQVEAPGQFSIRGSIIDIFPHTEEQPFRIDLWDEDIDSIKYFDTLSQRSVENTDEAVVFPASEYILSSEEIEAGLERIKKDGEILEKKFRENLKTEESHRIKTIISEFNEASIEGYIDYFCKETVSFLDYFDEKETVFFIDEPQKVISKGEVTQLEFTESMKHRLEKGYILPCQANLLFPFNKIVEELTSKTTVIISNIGQNSEYFPVSNSFLIEAKSINSYNNSFELLIKDLNRYKKEGYRIILYSASKTRAERLAINIRDFDLNAFFSESTEENLSKGQILVTYGNLHSGFEYPGAKLVVISESDIFGNKKPRKKRKTKFQGDKISSFTDLSIGDYVVHENHGLGIYRGIEKIEVDKTAKDYIKIEYAGSGNLYIPATGFDVIQKFADADSGRHKLNKLGSQEWNKTKTRVRGAVRDVAKDLVRLYAIRQAKEGYRYSEDTVWQKEFEELFPYVETEDQLTAIEDTKRDMESARIMDRLICGDVGYGKTEVAIRAAFKAAQENKQTAILVPTTILALQHYNNICERMKNYPVRVELLSRFRTPGETKKILEDLKKGMVDIVVGTHKLLSDSIQFKDLGLLVIDEEQRFGVTHKEKIKKLRQDVDVLTLTATPIPRTLHMSLIGIRDMSVLEEPPVDRVPIQTYVMEYDEEIVREAINRELIREGQVYYVYNRVSSIDTITHKIAELCPDAVVKYAHGQMNERELEKVMFEFMSGEIDVLVSTTIIETGLDISNVNTMIIHDADMFGLSQLYQLRGRVGRKDRTAFAFLMYRRDKMLKETAEKRLQAIREFTDLGSGFKIAMRDLEIRGAGNILGEEQHGHMEAVGYDLYCKMLNEAVAGLKGLEVQEGFETTVEFNIDAFIPGTYIRNEIQKLDMYKRISVIESQEDLEDIQDELIDRFGDMPKAVENLLFIAYVKALLHKCYVTEVSTEKGRIKLSMFKNAKIDVGMIPVIIENKKGRLKFSTDENPHFIYSPKENISDIKNLKENMMMLIKDMETLKIK